jgi:prepilin-type N-terminal cleavage/methylation domain-containing protein
MNKIHIKKDKQKQAGFTIIELLIATLIFSTILILATSAIIEITQTYIRGYIESNTQNVNRTLVDQIDKSIQFSSGNITISGTTCASGSTCWFCVNGNLYVYKYGLELTSASGDIFMEEPNAQDCNDPAASPTGELNLGNPPSGSIELLTTHMTLVPPAGNASLLTQVPIDNSNQELYSVNINILYGDPGSYGQTASQAYYCEPISSGGTFCAISGSSSNVEQRTESL